MKGPFILFIFSFIHTPITMNWAYCRGARRCSSSPGCTQGPLSLQAVPTAYLSSRSPRPCLCSVHQGWPSGFSTFCLSSPNNIDLNNVSHPKLRHATKNFHFYFWLKQLGSLLGSLLSLLGSLVDCIPIPHNVEDVFYSGCLPLGLSSIEVVVH